MDFRGIVEDTAVQTETVIREILAMDISRDSKIEQITKVFIAVGAEFAPKLFNDLSYLLDSEAITSAIETNINRQIESLAIKIVRDSAFVLNDGRLTKEYFDVLLARAEDAAFKNANSLEKHPTLTRRMTGRETCEWCRARVGTFEYPNYELFARHDDCDCIFTVSGYNSRNGVLKNYRKKG